MIGDLLKFIVGVMAVFTALGFWAALGWVMLTVGVVLLALLLIAIGRGM